MGALVKVERVIEIPLGGEVAGLIVGSLMAVALMQPWWVLPLGGPAVWMVLSGLIEELSEERLPSIAIAGLAAFVAVVEVAR